MKDLKKIVNDTIGAESFYPLEKTQSAIFSCDSTNIIFTKDMLNILKSNYEKLNQQIKDEDFYDDYYFDVEFKTLLLAINKLDNLLDSSTSEEDRLEAIICQSHIRSQDKRIREALEELDH
ncbi:hypothetical protein ACX1N5_01625 [Acinetobacter sp. ANC 4636]